MLLQKKAEEDVNELERWLSRFQSFLGDKEREKGRSRVSQDLANQIQDCTFDIHVAFDEFIFAVPTSKLDRTKQKVSYPRTYKSALDKLSERRHEIKKKIDSQSDLNFLSQNGGSTGKILGGPVQVPKRL